MEAATTRSLDSSFRKLTTMPDGTSSTSTATIVALSATLGGLGLAAAIWFVDWLIRKRHGWTGTLWGFNFIPQTYAHKEHARDHDLEAARLKQNEDELASQTRERRVSFSDEKARYFEGLGRHGSAQRGRSVGPSYRRDASSRSMKRRIQAQNDRYRVHGHGADSWTVESEDSDLERGHSRRWNSTSRSAIPCTNCQRKEARSARHCARHSHGRTTSASKFRELCDDDESSSESESEIFVPSTRSAPNMLFGYGYDPWGGHPAGHSRPAWLRQALGPTFRNAHTNWIGALNYANPYAPAWQPNTIGEFQQVDNVSMQPFAGASNIGTPKYSAPAYYPEPEPLVRARVEEVEPVPVELYHSPPEASPNVEDWHNRGVEIQPAVLRSAMARPKPRPMLKSRGSFGKRSTSSFQAKKKSITPEKPKRPKLAGISSKSADGNYGEAPHREAASRTERSEDIAAAPTVQTENGIGMDSEIIELPEIPTPPLAHTHDRRVRGWDTGGPPVLGIEVVRIGPKLEKVMRGNNNDGTRARNLAERGFVAGQVASIEGVQLK